MKTEWDKAAIARAQAAAAKSGKPVPLYIRQAQSKLAKAKNLK